MTLTKPLSTQKKNYIYWQCHRRCFYTSLKAIFKKTIKSKGKVFIQTTKKIFTSTLYTGEIQILMTSIKFNPLSFFLAFFWTKSTILILL